MYDKKIYNNNNIQGTGNWVSRKFSLAFSLCNLQYILYSELEKMSEIKNQ